MLVCDALRHAACACEGCSSPFGAESSRYCTEEGGEWGVWSGETYLPRCPRGRRLRHGKRRRVLDAPRVKRRLGTSGGRSLLRAGARSATVRQQCRAPRQGAAPWVAGQVGAEFKSWWGSKYGRRKKRTSVTLGTLLSLSSYSSERQNGGEAGAADGIRRPSTRQHRRLRGIDRLDSRLRPPTE